mgnify:CR=1 FL=1
MQIIAEVLVALRRIIRATDMRSRQLLKTVGLTTPQLLVLRAIQPQGEITVTALAQAVSLSQGTVTSIIDRLESRGLVTRERARTDKRKVLIKLLPVAHKLLENAPQPLQAEFIREFGKLPTWEQHMILAALQQVAHLMSADKIDAAPVLDIGALDQPEPAPTPDSLNAQKLSRAVI